MKPTRLFLALCFATLATSPCFAQDVRPTKTVMIPMRDGIRLASDVYLPTPDAKDLPLLLIQTPYGRGNYNHEWGARAKQWGYAVAIQDMRARGDSEGVARAFM